VLRCFEDDDVTHVEGGVDPLRDLELIETELLLADLESLERQRDALVKRAKGSDKEAKERLALAEKLLPSIGDGIQVRSIDLNEDERALARGFQLITAKPVLYVLNVEEASAATGNAHSAKVAAEVAKHDAGSVVISASIEAELAQLTEEESVEYLQTLGLDEPGLNKVIRAGHDLLGLLTFFTVGPKEARAWTTHRGATAPEAAGEIHTDFQRGFICAEIIAFDDYVTLGGEQKAKEVGKMRLEGKEYVVKDGDVCHFRFNV
jgi:GTP-binding protein YchF